jgi:hypothetical protein
MELSYFLAKLFGLYLMVLCLSVIVRKDGLSTLADEFFQNRSFVFFSGALILIFGLYLVLSHNVWELSWRGVITLIGWLTVFKGIIRLFIPERAKSLSKKVVTSPVYTPILALFFFLGVWLTYIGFWQG